MTYWIIPCNLKYYDVFGAFENNKVLDWKQSNPTINPGDQIFVYVGAPVQAIAFRCKVLEVNLRRHFIDDSEFSLVPEKFVNHDAHMRLELIEKYDTSALNYAVMQEYGEKGRIMCQRRMGAILKAYIDGLNISRKQI